MDDCPGHDGLPSGKIVMSTAVSGAELNYNDLSLIAGIQYELSMFIKVDAFDSCGLEFFSPQFKYFGISTESGDAVTNIPSFTWVKVSGSFIAQQGQTLNGKLLCSDPSTVHFSEIKLTRVSSTVYTSATIPRGTNAVPDPSFSSYLTFYSSSTVGGAQLSRSPAYGILATFPNVIDDEGSGTLVHSELNLKTKDNVNVVKGTVYVVSVNLVPNRDIPRGCTASMSISAGYSLGGLGFSTALETLRGGETNHLAGVIVAPANSVSVSLQLQCTVSEMIQTQILIDRFSLTAVPA